MHTHRTSSLSWVRRWAGAMALASVAGVALAQTATTDAPAAVTTHAVVQDAAASNTPRLNIGHIYDLVDQAGYREVREIEWSDGRYEVKARNAQGERVKLELDGSTGAVLRTRTKP